MMDVQYKILAGLYVYTSVISSVLEGSSNILIWEGNKYLKQIYHQLGVSDYEILRHHDSRAYIYHDCENYHDYHIMPIFSTNKLYKSFLMQSVVSVQS